MNLSSRAIPVLLSIIPCLAVATARAEPVAKPPPTSLAWQLRPAAAGNVVRSDTSVAAYDDASGSGTTVVSNLLASYKVTPSLAPVVRIAIARNDPGMGESATSMSNPLLGVTWGRPLAPAVKLAVFGGLALPLGTGGGNSPDAAMATANRSAMAARSAMDNALFAVNDLTPIIGVDVAYVAGGFTVQAEATVLQLMRVRGDEAQPDSAKTNFTSGVHAGYFPLPWLSIGGELRYQRYLSTPAFVEADPTGASRDNLSAAIGLRGHVALGNGRWLRPGVAYSRGLDDPMSGRSYDVVQVDVPFVF
jgi:hypothetical protein